MAKGKGWNYRIVKFKSTIEDYFGVCEVYYNEKGEAFLHDTDPLIIGCTPEEVRKVVDRIKKDIANIEPMDSFE